MARASAVLFAIVASWSVLALPVDGVGVNPALRAGLAGRVLSLQGKGRVASNDGSAGRHGDALKLRVRKGVEILEAWQDSGKAIKSRLTSQELTSRVSSIGA